MNVKDGPSAGRLAAVASFNTCEGMMGSHQQWTWPRTVPQVVGMKRGEKWGDRKEYLRGCTIRGSGPRRGGGA